jgi:hypothetical protein
MFPRLSPIEMAIEMGHLYCAKWLVDVAGLQVASIEDWIYRTPFYAACETGNIECAKWLIEIGGTSDILELKRLPLHAHKTFYSNIQRRIHNFTAINILLLQSQVDHRSLTPSVDRDTTSAHLQVHTPASLQGFEFALIKMIADFIDVPIPCGKPLRRLREIHDALLSLVYS